MIFKILLSHSIRDAFLREEMGARGEEKSINNAEGKK